MSLFHVFFQLIPWPGLQVGGELGKVTGLVARAEVSLHELSSSTDIEKAWLRCFGNMGFV